MNIKFYQYEFYPNKKDIGRNIKQYRKNIGITASQLADYLWYDTKTVNKWEQGRGIPSDIDLMKLASIFKCKIDDLIFNKNQCIVNYKIDYSYLHTSSNPVSDYLDEFFVEDYNIAKTTTLDEANNYSERKIFLIQKYLKAFLSDNEMDEMCYFINSEFNLTDSKESIINLLSEIKECVDIVDQNYLDKFLFLIEKNKMNFNKDINLFLSLNYYCENDYEKFNILIKNISLYKKEMFFNFIVNSGMNEFEKLKSEFIKQNLRLNDTYFKFNKHKECSINGIFDYLKLNGFITNNTISSELSLLLKGKHKHFDTVLRPFNDEQYLVIAFLEYTNIFKCIDMNNYDNNYVK